MALPGRTHDLTAVRVWGILRELDKAGILTLADKGYQCAEASVVITPYKGHNKPESQKQGQPLARQAPRTRRTRERSTESWKLLRRLRCSPCKAGHLVKAIAVLQNYEITRGMKRSKVPSTRDWLAKLHLVAAGLGITTRQEPPQPPACALTPAVAGCQWSAPRSPTKPPFVGAADRSEHRAMAPFCHIPAAPG
ncbi:transposase family protein [Spirillospora sp. NPDC000708]